MSKWIKRKPHISLGLIKIDHKAIVEVDSNIFSPTIGLLAKTEAELEGIIIIEIIHLILEIDPEIITDLTTEEIITSPMRDVITTDRTIGGEIAIDKTIEIDRTIEGMALDRDRSEIRDRLRNYSNDST